MAKGAAHGVALDLIVAITMSLLFQKPSDMNSETFPSEAAACIAKAVVSACQGH